MEESRGPGSGGCCCEFAAPAPATRCCMVSKYSQLFEIESSFVLFSRGMQRLHVHLSPLVLGVGRRKATQTNM